MAKDAAARGLGARAAGVAAMAHATNTIVSLGDSRVANGAPTGTTTGTNWMDFHHVGNALMGHRLVEKASLGVAGDRTDQVLVRLPLALAQRPGFIRIWCGVNDINQGLTDATAFANIKAMADAALAIGSRPILVTDGGNTAFTTTQQGYIFDLNERIHEYVEANAGAILFDEANAVWNPANGALAFRSGYSSDGLHRTSLGGYFGGKAFAALMSPLVPALQCLPGMAGDKNSATLRSAADNGFFTTTTGGTTTGTSSGTVPASYTAFGSTTATNVISSATNADGYGNDAILTAGGAANDSAWLRQAPATTRFSTGDIVQGVCEVTVASPVNFQGAALSLDMTVGGQAYSVYDGYSVGGGGGPTEGFTATLRTPQFVVPSGSITASTMRVQVGFSAASGSVVVNTRRWAIRRRFA